MSTCGSCGARHDEGSIFCGECGQPLEARSGVALHGYSDIEEIARGGFAVVYRATQDAFGRDVAIKVLLPLSIDATVIRRFEREARSMASLSWHPNIITVFDAGTTNEGRPYIAMEYAPEGSYGDLLERRGRLSPDDVAAVGVAIADGLQAAHEAGVLHCDVKPENILQAPSGQPALTDFGIAAVQNATHTRAQSVTASLAYAAPEILDGHPPTVATDIYSLGATLHALAAGKPAFVESPDDSFLTVIKRVATQPVPDLRAAGVPDEFCAVIERAMAKDPADRYEAAAAFRDAIAETSAVPATSTPTVTIQRRGSLGDGGSEGATTKPGAGGRRSRRPLLLAAAGAVVAVVVIGAVLVLSGGDSSDQSERATPTTDVEEQTTRETTSTTSQTQSTSRQVSAAAAALTPSDLFFSLPGGYSYVATDPAFAAEVGAVEVRTVTRPDGAQGFMFVASCGAGSFVCAAADADLGFVTLVLEQGQEVDVASYRLGTATGWGWRPNRSYSQACFSDDSTLCSTVIAKMIEQYIDRTGHLPLDESGIVPG